MSETTNAPDSGASESSAAVAFIALLSAEQLDALQYHFDDTAANATWSNLPVNLVPRNGVAFGDLTDEQLAAAKAVAEAFLSDEGFAKMEAIIAADDVLNALAASGAVQAGGQAPAAPGTAAGGAPPGRPLAGPQGSGGTPPGGGAGGGPTWGSDYYYIAFFGTPSADEPWMVQIGGHHLAYNVTFDGGAVSVTPAFAGIEPQTWETDGVTYAPLADEVSAAFGMFGGMTEAQLAAAKLDMTFNDVVVGPGEGGQFPATGGVRAADLSAEQQALVLEAIERWVGDYEDSVADGLMAKYAAELGDTYVAFAGSMDSTLPGSYVRIDGPSVWIEIINQAGVGTSGIHNHSVYRDKDLDYLGGIDDAASLSAEVTEWDALEPDVSANQDATGAWFA